MTARRSPQVAQRLRERREELGWPTYAVAAWMSVPTSTYQGWEHGRAIHSHIHRAVAQAWLDDPNPHRPQVPPPHTQPARPRPTPRRILVADLQLPTWRMPRRLLTGPVTTPDAHR